MGAGGILCRNYDWVELLFSTNQNADDNPVFSCSQLVPAMDGDSTSVTVIMEVLVQSKAAEFLSLLGSDSKEIMLINEGRSECR